MMTPGPWAVETHHRQGHDRPVPVWYVKASNGVGVAVQPAYSTDEHGPANAKAITSVPDMVDELLELREYFAERADAEYDAGSAGATGNEEMRRLVAIDAVLLKAGVARLDTSEDYREKRGHGTDEDGPFDHRQPVTPCPEPGCIRDDADHSASVRAEVATAIAKDKVAGIRAERCYGSSSDEFPS